MFSKKMKMAALSGRGPFHVRFADGSQARFDAAGNLVRGDAHGFEPNDILFVAWRQGQDVRWSKAKCAAAWVALGNPTPKEGL